MMKRAFQLKNQEVTQFNLSEVNSLRIIGRSDWGYIIQDTGEWRQSWDPDEKVVTVEKRFDGSFVFYADYEPKRMVRNV